MKLFHFKKFLGLRWQTSIASESALIMGSRAGDSYPLDLKAPIPAKLLRQYVESTYDPERSPMNRSIAASSHAGIVSSK